MKKTNWQTYYCCLRFLLSASVACARMLKYAYILYIVAMNNEELKGNKPYDEQRERLECSLSSGVFFFSFLLYEPNKHSKIKIKEKFNKKNYKRFYSINRKGEEIVTWYSTMKLSERERCRGTYFHHFSVASRRKKTVCRTHIHEPFRFNLCVCFCFCCCCSCIPTVFAHSTFSLATVSVQCPYFIGPNALEGAKAMFKASFQAGNWK